MIVSNDEKPMSFLHSNISFGTLIRKQAFPYSIALHFPPLHFWPSRIFGSRIFSRPVMISFIHQAVDKYNETNTGK